jgi:hypothetical protein
MAVIYNTIPGFTANVAINVPSIDMYTHKFEIIRNDAITLEVWRPNACAVCNPDTCQKSSNADNYIMECFDTNPVTGACEPRWVPCGLSDSRFCIDHHFACCPFGPGSNDTKCCQQFLACTIGF